MKIKGILFKLTFLITPAFSCGQLIVNGGLDGNILGYSSLPNNWQSVPYTYINCLATDANGATPDLTSLTSPSVSTGINGNPYSGSTFVSGALISNFSTVWHEGIMQTVTGFTANKTYKINFYQSIVKQNSALDQSGSWGVYIDTLLAGVASPTFNSQPYTDITFGWEKRTITFVANATTHTIIFLPFDDDNNINLSETDITGALRLGIDEISIEVCQPPEVNLGLDGYLCSDSTIILNASYTGGTYIWQDSSKNHNFIVNQPGTYWVNVTVNNCSKIDSIEIKPSNNCDFIPNIPNVFTPNADNINDVLIVSEVNKSHNCLLSIYNRWGNLVFKTDTPAVEFWSGKDMNGKESTAGVYYYILENKSFNKIYKGNIHLIK